MSEVYMLAIDPLTGRRMRAFTERLAKRSFQVCAVDHGGVVIFN